METIGEYFKLKREESGLTYGKISEITKIRPQYIETIEKNDFSLFSSPQILKGYIKLIGKTVGADEEYAFSLLEPQLKEGFKDKNVEDILGMRFKEEKQISYKFKKRIIITITAAIVIIILSFASMKVFEFFKFKHRGLAVTSFRLSPKIAPGRHLKKRKKSILKYAVILKGSVTKKTWVAVRIDDKGQKTYMLYPGDVETWKAKKDMRIKIGNAGGIRLNYNGKSLGKLGKEKEVITLNFPAKSKEVNPANPNPKKQKTSPASG
ncbi:MAG: helix-turn-helix domain-containing protein [Candidatus Acidulodesulfobacterium ferriphilum]|uniref:Helix-turn-helix domain-containing protein n=1 Tax=Candidatus Acidulodesulfobacterium ferriphilum TaxID=2597223 RepID=A0A519BCA1_9DELT|nr:MAG: helix-turn-helix domain-containing protein [Candidatus Acidulodesulfobacterium ferriphilum]